MFIVVKRWHPARYPQAAHHWVNATVAHVGFDTKVEAEACMAEREQFQVGREFKVLECTPLQFFKGEHDA